MLDILEFFSVSLKYIFPVDVNYYIDYFQILNQVCVFKIVLSS